MIENKPEDYDAEQVIDLYLKGNHFGEATKICMAKRMHDKLNKEV